MTGFAFMEPIPHANSKNFALAVMHIQLCYGFCHTIFLITTANFEAFAGKPLTFCKAIAMLFQGTITAQ
jgi:hypothetical protein